MILEEYRRFFFILKIFLIYGLDEGINKTYIALPLRIIRYVFFYKKSKNHIEQSSLGERLRLALQELGPVWIKFGQMLSTCHHILPKSVTNPLTLLQNKVAPFDGLLAKQHIEKSMGNLPIDTWFDDFDIVPLASASIAQVHSAKLKENGKNIVIKIIRPDILPIIQSDIKLIYFLARWVSYWLSMEEQFQFHPIEIVKEYEKTLIGELNLLQESANAIQLRRNFKDSRILYVPEIYVNYCRKNMIVMERIDGISISNIKMLHKNGTNMKLLAERGVQIFFTQVFRDSFFHADMHPGNIFVSYKNPENPQYIGVDYGVVGSLSKDDKRYIAENFIAFFNRNYRKVAELHIDAGWVPYNVNVEEFEFAIRTVCEPIFEKPLEEISFGHVLLNLFIIARRFNMEIQPQLILLQKTLLYIEGIGHQIYPELNLWKTAKPFLESWIKNQISITSLLHSLKEKMPVWIEHLPEIPEMIYDTLYQKRHARHNSTTMLLFKNKHAYYGRLCYFFAVGAVLFISGTLLLFYEFNLKWFSTSLIIISSIIWFIGYIKMFNI